MGGRARVYEGRERSGPQTTDQPVRQMAHYIAVFSSISRLLEERGGQVLRVPYRGEKERRRERKREKTEVVWGTRKG